MRSDTRSTVNMSAPGRLDSQTRSFLFQKHHSPVVLAGLEVNMSTVHQHSERAESQDKGNLILALCWSFTALGATFVTLRLFVQTTIRRSIRSEDCWSGFTIVRTFQTSSTVDLYTHSALSHVDLHYIILYSIDDFCLLRQWETL